MGDYEMNKLYLITGPCGIGKSTVSIEIAKRIDKSVLIEGDDIYNFFVGGRISPWKDGAPLDLFWDNCIYLINSYLSRGYDVIFNYIIDPKDLEMLRKKFSDYQIIFKVLIAKKDVVIKRDKMRIVDNQMGNRAVALLDKFINNYSDEFLLDTSLLSVDEVVERIMLL